MITLTKCIVAAIAITLLLTGVNLSCKRGYIIPSSIDIHCEIQAVPFLRPFSSKRAELERAQLSQMKPGEPSAAIRERVIKARTIADLVGSEKVESMHIAEAIGYRCSALCDAFIVERRKNLDRGDWAERGV